MNGTEIVLHYNKLMHFLFLSNFDVITNFHLYPGQNVAMISNTWSVAIEEQFYLFWPLLFYFLKPNFYKYIFPLAIAVSLGFRLFNEADKTVIYFHSLSALNDLATGGLVAYLSLNSKRFLAFIQTMKKGNILLVYLSGFLFLLANRQLHGIPIVHSFVRIFDALFFAFVILEQNFALHSFKKFGDWNFIARLGTISYGLYLLHPLCLMASEIGWRYLPVEQHAFWVHIVRGIIALILCIVVSMISFRFFESFFLKWKTKFAVVQSH